MSSIASIMSKLETLAINFKHVFDAEVGEVAVFNTVKIYIDKNFKKAAQDLLMIRKPALVIVYPGSKYERESKAASHSATRKAVDKRTADFVFLIADQEYGAETASKGAFGGTQARGAVVVLDLWRDRLTLVDPLKDFSLPLSPFKPIDDSFIPVDPEVGNVTVYSLTMQTSFYENASA